MATTRYYARATATETGTDGSGVRDLLTASGGSSLTTQNVNDTAFQETQRFINNHSSGEFETGALTWAGQINVASTNGNSLEGRFRFQRRNSSGVVQSSSAYSATFSTAGIKTLSTTWNPGTWSVGDRLCISVEIRRTGGHGNVNMDINLGTTSWVDAQLQPQVPLYNQARFRARTVNPTTAGANAAFDAGDPAENADLSFGSASNVSFRVRYQIDDNIQNGGSTPIYDLRYRVDGGSWNLITSSSSVIRTIDNTSYANNTATTALLTAGPGSFLAGYAVDNGTTTSEQTWTGNQYTEIDASLEMVAADVTPGQAIDIRVFIDGAIPDNTAQELTINVLAPTYGITDWRIYQDGSEETSTPYNTAKRAAVVPQDTPVQIRMLVENTGASGTLDPKLQYRYWIEGTGGAVDPTAWADVTATSDRINAVAGTPTDNEATAQRLGSGTYTAGKYDEGDGQFDSGWALPANNETEVVFSVEIDSTDVASDQEEYEFRIVNRSDGAAYNSYPEWGPRLNAELFWEHGFEGGTDGNDINTTVADPDTIDGLQNGPGFWTYTDVNAFDGSIAGSLVYTSGGTPAHKIRWYDLNQAAVVWFRTFHRYGVMPGGDHRILQATDHSDAVNPFAVHVDSSNRLQLRDGTGVIATATASLSAGTYYRIELMCIPETATGEADGTLLLRYYEGNSTTLIQEIGVTGTATTGTEVEDIDYGVFTDVNQSYLVDRIAVSNLDWIGPIGGSPQSISVNVASETETANTVAAESSQSITISVASETEAAQAVTADTTISVSVSVVSETETANAVTADTAVSTAVSVASETETAQSVTVDTSISVSIGVASEIETAQAIQVDQSTQVAVGVASETEAAVAITSDTTVTIAVGISSETETAGIITAGRTFAIGQASETEAAQAVAADAAISIPVGTASETEVANAVAADTATTVSIGTASETETANAVAVDQSTQVAIGVASETEAAQSITVNTAVTVSVTVASETEAANGITADTVISIAVGVAPEAETANTVTVNQSQSVVIGVSSETETAQAIQIDRSVSVGVTSETETAQTVVVNIDQSIAVGVASETETAIAAPAVLGTVVNVITASETELANLVAGDVTVLVIVATETEAAGSVPSASAISVSVATASEVETAQAVTVDSSVSTPIVVASETEAANTVTAVTSVSTAVGVAGETESAVAVAIVTGGAPQTIPVGVASETETAIAVTADASITVQVTPAAETETADLVGVLTAVSVSISQALETETAQIVQPLLAQSIAVGIANESETAVGVGVIQQGGPQTIVVSWATETESAVAIGIIQQQIISVSIAAETESAQSVPVATSYTTAIAAASETEQAQAIAAVAGNVNVTVDAAPETELARPIGINGNVIVTVSGVSESETAEGITVNTAYSASIAAAQELETAIAVPGIFPAIITVDPATETELAIAIGALGQVPELVITNVILSETGKRGVMVSDTGMRSVSIADDGRRNVDVRYYSGA